RHHADDGANAVVETKPAPDHAEVAPELALPKPVAQHDDRFGAWLRIVRVRCAAYQRSHPHDIERIERAMVSTQPLWIALAGPQHVADGGSDGALENRVALGDLEKLVGRVAGPTAPRCRARDPDAHQSVHVLIGKRIENDRM